MAQLCSGLVLIFIRSRVSGVVILLNGSPRSHMTPLPLLGVVGWRPDGQRSRLSLLGQMKMEVDPSGETPSTGPPGADDGGAAGIVTLLEGIILGSA